MVNHLPESENELSTTTVLFLLSALASKKCLVHAFDWYSHGLVDVIISVDELTKEIKKKVINLGIMAKKAIPESYPLLRTIQLVTNGYYKKP
jgi:hypothetical protein